MRSPQPDRPNPKAVLPQKGGVATSASGSSGVGEADQIDSPGFVPLYADYFGCREAPFAIAPDPHYLYMSAQHQEALAHLLYGIQGDGGFVLLTGEVGTGKTTLCRCFLEQLPSHCEVALVINPKLNARDMLLTICEELALEHPLPEQATDKILIDRINQRLLSAFASGKTTLLIIDEAQNLSLDVLEQVRLLTNLETDKRKLLQVIMIGQPELRQVLARPELRQLAQRITARCHLGPLDPAQTGRYIRHRLMISGYRGPAFPGWSLRRIHRLSGGIPRLINVLCDRILLGTYVEGHWLVKRKVVAQAARELFGDDRRWALRAPSRWRPSRWRPALSALALTAVLGAGLVSFDWERGARLAEWFRCYWSAPSASFQPPAAAPAAAVSPSLSQAKEGEEAAEGLRQVPAQPLNAGMDFDWAGAGTLSAGPDLLLELWGVPASGAIADPCLQAQVEGLQCLKGTATWTDLLAYDRPALLEVSGRDGRAFMLALVELQGDLAWVAVARQRLRTSVKALQERWNGNTLLLWKPPPGYQRELRLGDRGAVVAWLVARLEKIRETSIGVKDPLLFDQRVEQMVIDFQQSLGLAPDGIVGPRTLMRLNTLTEPRVPLLSPEGKRP